MSVISLFLGLCPLASLHGPPSVVISQVLDSADEYNREPNENTVRPSRVETRAGQLLNSKRSVQKGDDASFSLTSV